MALEPIHPSGRNRKARRAIARNEEQRVAEHHRLVRLAAARRPAFPPLVTDVASCARIEAPAPAPFVLDGDDL